MEILELKTEIKYLDELNRKLKMTKERVNEPENRSTEIVQSEEEREKSWRKKKK